MKNKILKSWVLKVLGKFFWLLGFIPLILDFILAYIPQKNIPPFVRSYIDSGATLPITLGFVILGFIFSAYLVNKEDQDRIRKLESKIEETIISRPSTHVKLCFRKHEPASEINIPLTENPPKPDFDKLIYGKRDELIGKKITENTLGSFHEALRSLSQSALLSTMNEPNPDYEEEVEEYLEEYREYLIRKYEFKLDRAFKLYPFVVNDGPISATSASLELIMPKDYDLPKDHQMTTRSDYSEFDIEYYGLPPIKPKPYKPLLNPLSSLTYLPPTNEKTITEESRSIEPTFHSSEGKWRITYKLDELVPMNPLRDFDPFWIWSGEVKIGDKWEIIAKMFASELSQPLESKLIIHFVKSE